MKGMLRSTHTSFRIIVIVVRLSQVCAMCSYSFSDVIEEIFSGCYVGCSGRVDDLLLVLLLVVMVMRV
jgi:hypothetical protein